MTLSDADREAIELHRGHECAAGIALAALSDAQAERDAAQELIREHHEVGNAEALVKAFYTGTALCPTCALHRERRPAEEGAG